MHRTKLHYALKAMMHYKQLSTQCDSSPEKNIFCNIAPKQTWTSNATEHPGQLILWKHPKQLM